MKIGAEKKPDEIIIEENVNQQQEFTLLNTQRKHKGHILFEYNKQTGEIRQTEFVESDTYVLGEKTHKVVINPHCHYDQALNKKNFIK
jgi:hypothetical protein